MVHKPRGAYRKAAFHSSEYQLNRFALLIGYVQA